MSSTMYPPTVAKHGLMIRWWAETIPLQGLFLLPFKATQESLLTALAIATCPTLPAIRFSPSITATRPSILKLTLFRALLTGLIRPYFQPPLTISPAMDSLLALSTAPGLLTSL